MGSIATPRMALALLPLYMMMTSSLFYVGESQSPAAAPMAALGPTAPGPAASSDCFTLLLGTADCLSYVMEGSNLTKPDKACCPELKTLVDTNPVCLCELLANGSNYGYDIDIDRATKLPNVCKVETPPLTTCALLGYPVGGPAPSESPAEAQGPSSGVLPTATARSPTALSPAENDGSRASVTFASFFMATLVGFAILFF